MARKKPKTKNHRANNRGEKNVPSTIEREPKFEKKEEEKPERIESKTVPISVYSRLGYPFLIGGSLLNEDNDEEEEQERLELKVKPRFVFVASRCAVCYEIAEIPCESCRMLWYCSAAHRSRGSNEHRDLCESLSEIRSLIETAVTKSPEYLDGEQYRVLRIRLLGILESRVLEKGRPLNLWEKEIVLYPRVCRICHKFRDDVSCRDCGMESFCPEHRDEHVKWCEQFRVFQRCLYLQNKHGSVDPEIPRTLSEVFEITDFDETMHRVYGDRVYYRQMDCYTYAMLSHVCTNPLTTLYAIRSIFPLGIDPGKKVFTVHVIGAEFHFEGVNLHVWERMFLHFLPNVKTLRIELIGPELYLPNGVPAHLFSRIDLCSACKNARRSVQIQFRENTVYHEFVRESTAADLICAYNPGLYRKTGFMGKDTWPETIRAFCKSSTPVLVTSYTANEIVWEIDRIKSIDSGIQVIAEPQRNPFASIKPDRNFVTDDTNPLIYKNYYFTIVKGS